MGRKPRLPRRLKSKLLKALVVCLAVLAAAAAAPGGASAPHERGIVTRVVDGDTLVVQLESGKPEHVRLIGIDTPESKPNKRALLQAGRSHRDEQSIVAMGKDAFRATEQISPPGTAVTLEYDVQPRDKYRRLLAYVHLPDGTMLNEEIVARGYAVLLTIPPNIRHTERFRRALDASRAARRGLWADAQPW